MGEQAANGHDPNEEQKPAPTMGRREAMGRMGAILAGLTLASMANGESVDAHEAPKQEATRPLELRELLVNGANVGDISPRGDRLDVDVSAALQRAFLDAEVNVLDGDRIEGLPQINVTVDAQIRRATQRTDYRPPYIPGSNVYIDYSTQRETEHLSVNISLTITVIDIKGQRVAAASKANGGEAAQVVTRQSSDVYGTRTDSYEDADDVLEQLERSALDEALHKAIANLPGLVERTYQPPVRPQQTVQPTLPRHQGSVERVDVQEQKRVTATYRLNSKELCDRADTWLDQKKERAPIRIQGRLRGYVVGRNAKGYVLELDAELAGKRLENIDIDDPNQ